jgi:hypothetical protein
LDISGLGEQIRRRDTLTIALGTVASLAMAGIKLLPEFGGIGRSF